MELLQDLLSFGVKGAIVVISISLVAVVVAFLFRRARGGRPSGYLEVQPLNRRFEALADGLRSVVLGKKGFSALLKERERSRAAKDRPGPAVYVLDFTGDLLASEVRSLREEVSAIVAVARPEDEVVVRLESPGGAVPHYGLAASQLARLKERGVKVTVCIDRLAASGGYMMACVADTIVAAPFAIIGSIGVVAQVPNLHRLLKKHDIDFAEMTAGEFKRTVTVFGEITERGRAKFQEQLEETHEVFKDFVKEHRPSLELSRVATGEYWLARKAMELNLVDRIGTSDDYLMSRSRESSVYRVVYRPETSIRERLGRLAAETTDRVVTTVLERLMVLPR